MAENKSKQNSVKRKAGSNTFPVNRGGGSSTANLPKVLRIGIIQNGKIIEERIVRKRANVHVGPSEKNDFVLSQEDVPTSRFCLFETKGAGAPYVLNFMSGMTGKLSHKGDVVELADVASKGTAQKRGKVFQLELTDDARGKVVMGNTTILFQFVTPPPIQPKPQLPAAVKGSPLQGVELIISICMIVSFAFHSGMIMYFHFNDWPEKTLEEKYADLQALLNAGSASFEKKETKIDKNEKGEGEEDEFEEVKEEKPKPSKKNVKPTKEAEDTGPKKSAEQIAKERADRRAALAEQIARQGINKILGSIGGSGEGAVADVLSGGDVAADQDDLLAQVNGVGVAEGGNLKLKGPAGGKGGGEAADVGQVAGKAGGDVKTAGPGPERSIKGKVLKKKPMASGGTGMMSSGDVAKVVNKRIGAIKGCYERALKRDPSLKGKITIRFTISGVGKVSAARATLNQLNGAVADCITGAFKRFRFPPPEGGTVTFEYPFLFTPAQ